MSATNPAPNTNKINYPPIMAILLVLSGIAILVFSIVLILKLECNPTLQPPLFAIAVAIAGLAGAGFGVFFNANPDPFVKLTRLGPHLFGLSLVLIVLAVVAVPSPCVPPPPPPIIHFDFESDTMGWLCQSGIAGCIGVKQSNAQFHDGTHSLEETIELNQADPAKRESEVWVERTLYDDLTDGTITIWVYAPENAKGNPNYPNGLQVYVKDNDWDALWGCWYNVQAGWQPIKLTVNTTNPDCGGWGIHLTKNSDGVFTPSQIRAIGVSIAVGTPTATPPPGSQAPFQYSGTIYIDDVDWSK